MGNVVVALAVTRYLTVPIPTPRSPFAAMLCTIAVIWIVTGAKFVGARAIGRLERVTFAIGLLPTMNPGTPGWMYFDPDVFAQSWFCIPCTTTFCRA